MTRPFAPLGPGARPLGGPLLALALGASPSLAAADTLRPFVPGRSPCVADCPLDWAAAEFGVPVGEPGSMALPAGSILDLMSYAVDHKPFVERRGFVTVQDHDGVGYRLPDGRVMFRLLACGNWTVATLPYSAAAPSMGIAQAAGASSAASVVAPRWTSMFAGRTSQGSAPPITLVGPGPDPHPPVFDQPTAVPLPWAGLLLVMGLGLLWSRIRRG